MICVVDSLPSDRVGNLATNEGVICAVHPLPSYSIATLPNDMGVVCVAHVHLYCHTTEKQNKKGLKQNPILKPANTTI